MYRYIFFDLDGTLTDSKEGISNCVRYALEKMGEPILSDDVLKYFIGPPLHDSYIRYCGFTREKALEAVRLFRSCAGSCGSAVMYWHCRLRSRNRCVNKSARSLGLLPF